PDDEGIFISPDKKLGLGFRRLAIIDLSPAGHQPMENGPQCEQKHGRITAMFNGEIYNFQELRQELERRGHRFRSKSDTEVILHSYEENGTDAVHKWNGMFAAALWDEQKRRLWLVRDRLGIKPLYYTVQNGAIIFGSEIKALLAHPLVKKKLNEEALFHYLTFSCCPAPMTLFEGIKKLPAGYFLTVDENGVKETQYWDAIPRQTSHVARQMSEDFFAENIRGILKDSV
ncbi:asparagine synthetase B, partial [Candidatus Peregrinibacteria bacterium]|nr:asparagine synthetase B [Candidatus Peregrinibacteria bacterium]